MKTRQDRLGKHQRAFVKKLNSFCTVWADEVYYAPEKRAIKTLIKRGLLAFDENDDNGGSYDFTAKGFELYGESQ